MFNNKVLKWGADLNKGIAMNVTLEVEFCIQ